MDKITKRVVGIGLIIIIILILIWAILFTVNQKTNPVVGMVPISDIVDTEPVVAGCDTGYENMPESKVASEESPALITQIQKKCDGNYYLTVDYLSPGNDNPDDDIGFYSNSNSKLRTFKVSNNFNVETITQDGNFSVPISAYIQSLTKYLHGPIFGQASIYMGPKAFSAVYTLKIQQGQIVSMNEVYLP